MLCSTCTRVPNPTPTLVLHMNGTHTCGKPGLLTLDQLYACCVDENIVNKHTVHTHLNDVNDATDELSFFSWLPARLRLSRRVQRHTPER
jgi:hypothetical protein